MKDARMLDTYLQVFFNQVIIQIKETGNESKYENFIIAVKAFKQEYTNNLNPSHQLLDGFQNHEKDLKRAYENCAMFMKNESVLDWYWKLEGGIISMQVYSSRKGDDVLKTFGKVERKELSLINDRELQTGLQSLKSKKGINIQTLAQTAAHVDLNFN